MQTAKLGIETYMLRDEMDADLCGTLAKLKSFGYEGLELWAHHYGQDIGFLREHIKESGLAVASWHTDMAMLVEDLDAVIAANRAVNCQSIVINQLPPLACYSGDAVIAAARLFDSLTARLEDIGMHLGFHNFNPDSFADRGGITPWHHFCDHCDPRFFMQLDVCMAAKANQNIPALILRTGERLKSTHMKPYTYGASTKLGGYEPMIGEDSLDYTAIRNACESVHVEWHLVEYEERTRYTPIYAAELCLERLRERGF